MRIDELNEDNHLLFAIKYYENPHAVTLQDFEEDLKRFKYIKRLFKKYVHLILNHFIICFNVFGEATVPLMFYKIEKEYWSLIKTFLIFLNRIPEYPKSGLDDIPIDEKCFSILKTI
jgi:hypothetical protein